MPNMNGKRVVVTGGSQGLGLAMLGALAARGANVIAIGCEGAEKMCLYLSWCRGQQPVKTSAAQLQRSAPSFASNPSKPRPLSGKG